MTRTLTRRSSKPAEEEEETPTASRSRRPLRGSSRSTSKPEPEDIEEEDDDDDEPAPRSRRRIDSKEDKPKRTISSGWSGYTKVRKETNEFAKNLEVTDEELVIKFLDKEPFATFNQHWIERKGKRSWPCTDECPLCDLGDKAKTQVMLNVLEFSDPDNPTVVVWQVGTMVADIIAGFAKSSKTSPIDRSDLYFSVNKTGGGKRGGRVSYNLRPIKERDLLADWDVEPLTEEEIEAYGEKAYGDDIVQIPTQRQLEEIADEISDED